MEDKVSTSLAQGLVRREGQGLSPQDRDAVSRILREPANAVLLRQATSEVAPAVAQAARTLAALSDPAAEVDRIKVGGFFWSTVVQLIVDQVITVLNESGPTQDTGGARGTTGTGPTGTETGPNGAGGSSSDGGGSTSGGSSDGGGSTSGDSADGGGPSSGDSADGGGPTGGGTEGGDTGGGNESGAGPVGGDSGGFQIGSGGNGGSGGGSDGGGGGFVGGGSVQHKEGAGATDTSDQPPGHGSEADDPNRVKGDPYKPVGG